MPFPSPGRVAVGVLIIIACTAHPAIAQTIGKGHRILIERGLQIQGMATRDDVFHLDTYQAARYTSINWLWDADVTKHGARPGFAWARWVRDPSDMPPRPGEAPFMGRLVALSLGDEKNLNDPAVREPYVEWFNSVRAKFPDTILYANNFGGQVNDAALSDFVARGKPDMLCFDTYPWRSNYTTRRSEPPAGGSPTQWYGDLRRYREHARLANIPLATYRQSFHAVQDYDSTVYRDPSPSEFRLNTFAALAYNVKFLIDFTYNTGSSSFFKTPGGDENPTPLYDELKRVNAEARNLGKALVRLKPVPDAQTPSRHTTGIVILRGRHMNGDTPAPNDLPIGFVPDPGNAVYSEWEFGRNDPHLTGWAVRNLGPKNHGLPGDVILSWFHVLDESLDGDATGEIYLMVTNGLCGMDGSAADYRQQVALDLKDYPHATIQRLSRASGRVEDVRLTEIGGKRRLTLTLEGGTGELLKFATGAPFVGADGEGNRR